MAPIFTVHEHVVPGQHIREYPGATNRNQEEVLILSVKQYTPTYAPDNIPTNALTIIGAHGIGFPKVSRTFICQLCRLAECLTVRRKRTSPFGKISIIVCRSMVYLYGVSGWRTVPTRLLVAS